MIRRGLIYLSFASLSLLVSCGDVDPAAQREAKALQDLKSSDESVRVDAVTRIGGMAADKVKGANYVPRLVKALGDDSAKVRAAALQSLSGLGEKGARGLKKMRQLATGDPSAEVRSLALVGADQLASGEAETLSLIESALGDESLAVALQSASLLTAHEDQIAAASGPLAGVVKKAILLDASEGGDPTAGLGILLTVAERGEAAKAAVPVLQTVVDDTNTPAPIGAAVKTAIDVINGKATADDLAMAIQNAGAGAPPH